MDITQLLTFAYQQGASDLHLSAGEPPMIRLHGDVKKVKMPALSAEQTHAMVYDIMGDKERKIFEEVSDVDFSMELGEKARFRVNVFRQKRGVGAVFRTIPTEILSLDKLGAPQVLRLSLIHI